MLKKFLAASLMIFFLSSGAVQAYDLPKFKPDKKVTKTVKQEKGPMLKSDWKSAELFEQKLKARLAMGKELSPADPARSPADKNYVFVAFYNGAPFFLDKYSITIRKNFDGKKVWEQKIFPISPNYSNNNAKATHQKFCLADGKFYNSTKEKDALSDVADETDRNFLQECFKVGYYFAFGEEGSNS